MTFRTVDSVMLYVRDLEVSIAFYRDVVRLPFKFKESGYAEFAMEGTKFGLLERSRLPGLIGREATQEARSRGAVPGRRRRCRG